MRMTSALLMIIASLTWAAGCGQKAGNSGGPQVGAEQIREDVAGSGDRESLPSDGSGTKPIVTTAVASVTEVALCGKCGQIKGGETCCLESAAVCSDCGLAKGSPGCCKITKGADVTLCTKCGQIKGSEACCDPNAAVCEKCGLAEGSPGCCKLGT